MLKKAFIVCCALFVFFQSCDYGILYENPQPDGAKDLQSFPTSLAGLYYGDSSGISLIIEPERVIKISEYDISASKDEIDTMPDCKLVGDSLFLSDLQKFIYVDLRNDSVFGVLANPDTLFEISKINILRTYKKNYFLSIAHESGFWQVVRLRKLKNDVIEFSVVPQKVEFDILNAITPVKQIKDVKDSTIKYHVNPSVKELKKMMKAGLFYKNEKYHR